MKKYQIAILAVCAVSALSSLISNLPAGYLTSAAIAVVLVLFWRKNDARQPMSSASERSPAPPARSEEHRPSIEPSSSTPPAPAKTASAQPAKEKVSLVTENFNVAGTSFHQEAIEELGSENSLYEYTKKELIDDGYEDEKIYQYEFFPEKVELVEEPENPHDPNAIKVIVDGAHIGYIKAGSCAHVKKLLRSGTVSDISAEIYGGKFKILSSDDSGDTYTLDKDSTPFGARVNIIYRK